MPSAYESDLRWHDRDESLGDQIDGPAIDSLSAEENAEWFRAMNERAEILNRKESINGNGS